MNYKLAKSVPFCINEQLKNDHFTNYSLTDGYQNSLDTIKQTMLELTESTLYYKLLFKRSLYCITLLYDDII